MSDTIEAAVAAEVLAYQAKELQWFLQHEGVQRAFIATMNRITKEWEKATDEPAQDAPAGTPEPCGPESGAGEVILTF
jgi:hypothetical protein